jgi:hypothetical protein
MNLRAGLLSAQDLLAKLKRDAELLESEVTSDRLFNFMVTAHALNDWVQNDPSVPQIVKDGLSCHRSDVRLNVCRDVANSLKHFELDDRNAARAVTESASSSTGFSVGRYGKGSLGKGEESISFTLKDGQRIALLPFCSQVVELWQSYLSGSGA